MDRHEFGKFATTRCICWAFWCLANIYQAPSEQIHLSDVMNQQFPALRMLSFQNGRPPTDSLMPYHQLSGDQTKDLDKDQRQLYKLQHRASFLVQSTDTNINDNFQKD